MANHRDPVGLQSYLDHIEPVPVADPPMAQPPGLREARHHSSLAPADGLTAGPEPGAAPGLHLDKGNEVTAPDDEIEVVVPEPEAMRLDVPPPRLEGGGRQGLPVQAQLVAGVAKEGGNVIARHRTPR